MLILRSQILKGFVLTCCLLVLALAQPAAGKSLYVIGDIGSTPIPVCAYDIQSAPSYLAYQATYGVPDWAAGAVGLAIDTDSEMLFITYELGSVIQLIDAKTMTNEGTVYAPGAYNLAGIVVDQEKQKVYTIDRNTDNLYVYSWDAVSKVLTLDVQINLANVTDGVGLALDEVNDELYVGEMVSSGNIDVFSTADWSHVASYTVPDVVLGIAVDVQNRYVYTGSAGWYGKMMCKYDLNTNTATSVYVPTLTGHVDDGAVGLAVDPLSGLLYVTTGNQGSEGRILDDTDCILVLDSDFNILYQTGDIGDPTGICIPGKDISYNPLNLAKNDAVQGVGVPIGQEFTYEMTYENTNAYDVTGVTLTDNLPPELDFITEYVGGVEGTGVYDPVSHTVVWDLGSLAAGAVGPLVELVVVINDLAVEGTTIYNFATIESNETGPTTQIGEDPDCEDCDPGTTPNPPEDGDIFGWVRADCPVEGTGLYGVPVDVYDVDNEVLYGSVVTDENGYYEFLEVPSGTYWVSIATPLGYVADEDTKEVEVSGGEYEVSFDLTCIEVECQARPRGYWAHQLTRAIDGRPQDYTLEDFMGFARLIDQHFNNNAINPVDYYTVPFGEDSLDVMQALLLMGDRDESHPFPYRIARAQLLALMLNVVSGNVFQMAEATEDGQNYSQIITYCDMLVTGELVPAYDEVDGYSSTSTEYYPHIVASIILHKANVCQPVPAGLVPADIYIIAYRFGDDAPLPNGYELFQNYPNPFNPETEIWFGLPEAGHVRLEVFNIAGQRVTTLTDGHYPAGYHTVTFDGSQVASGMYLYRLTTGDQILSKKMMLVK